MFRSHMMRQTGSLDGVTEMLGANGDFDYLTTGAGFRTLESYAIFNNYPTDYDLYWGSSEFINESGDNVQFDQQYASQSAVSDDFHNVIIQANGKLRVRLDNYYQSISTIDQLMQECYTAIPLNRFVPGDYHATYNALRPANGGFATNSIYFYEWDDSFGTANGESVLTGTSPPNFTELWFDTLPANTTIQTTNFTVTEGFQNLHMVVYSRQAIGAFYGATGLGRTGIANFEIKQGHV